MCKLGYGSSQPCLAGYSGLTSNRKNGQYQYPWRLSVHWSPMQCCCCIETVKNWEFQGWCTEWQRGYFKQEPLLSLPLSLSLWIALLIDQRCFNLPCFVLFFIPKGLENSPEPRQGDIGWTTAIKEASHHFMGSSGAQSWAARSLWMPSWKTSGCIMHFTSS